MQADVSSVVIVGGGRYRVDTLEYRGQEPDVGCFVRLVTDAFRAVRATPVPLALGRLT